MFTGLVEEIGKVKQISPGASSGKIRIEAKTVLEGTRIGDSIAVNGVCLTVTGLQGNTFQADVMAETVRRSSLKQLRPGSYVNLERAMAADGRFGGHLVSGHIDGTGTIVRVEREENAIWYRILAKPSLLHYIVEKGSIAVDGISLTVAKVDPEGFEVSVIPHTSAGTILQYKGCQDVVNLECDIIGKYVEKMLGGYVSGTKESGSTLSQTTKSRHQEAGITLAFLAENGF